MKPPRQPFRFGKRVGPGLVLLLVGVAGCPPRPHAPAIQDEPVYQNSQEGFKFVPPEGWKMHGRAEFPPGPMPDEHLLVEYKRLSAEKAASLEVSMIDVAPEIDLASGLPDRGGEFGTWKLQGAVERLEIGGRPAARAVFAGQSGGENTHKEIVAVRRGRRVYYFTGIFLAGDGRARDQVRRAVASVSF